ncbi:MAG: hypothetical protein HJJLKODD_00575 [Phycisphaerae bacterium]|nr:hypothetical protein [Phycisphaerae bacterium]
MRAATYPIRERQQPAMSLVEVLVAMLILGAASLVSMQMTGSYLQGEHYDQQQAVARTLAVSLMDEILAKKHSDDCLSSSQVVFPEFHDPPDIDGRVNYNCVSDYVSLEATARGESGDTPTGCELDGDAFNTIFPTSAICDNTYPCDANCVLTQYPGFYRWVTVECVDNISLGVVNCDDPISFDSDIVKITVEVRYYGPDDDYTSAESGRSLYRLSAYKSRTP